MFWFICELSSKAVTTASFNFNRLKHSFTNNRYLFTGCRSIFSEHLEFEQSQTRFISTANELHHIAPGSVSRCSLKLRFNY